METLSDKIPIMTCRFGNYDVDYVPVEAVKSFIEQLKEELSPRKFNNKRKVFLSINETINKLAGEKLI